MSTDETVEIVDDTRGRSFQKSRRRYIGVGGIEELIYLSLSKIGLKSIVQCVAYSVVLSLHRSSCDHTQCVERHLHSILVGISDKPGLQHTVVVARLGWI